MNAITPIARPELARWMFDRLLSNQRLADELKCSREYVRRMTLPATDPAYLVPSLKMRRRIETFTHGDIAPTSWPQPARALAA